MVVGLIVPTYAYAHQSLQACKGPDTSGTHCVGWSAYRPKDSSRPQNTSGAAQAVAPRQASPRICGPSAINTGACVGWTSYGHESPYIAAVRSLVQSGDAVNLQRAEYFVAMDRTLISASVFRRLTQAIKAALRGDRELADKVLQSRFQPAVAPQQTHGETKAMSYYNWVLHGDSSVNLYYGDCGANGCETLGHGVGDIEANTYNLGGDGQHWSTSLTRVVASPRLSAVSLSANFATSLGTPIR